MHFTGEHLRPNKHREATFDINRFNNFLPTPLQVAG